MLLVVTTVAPSRVHGLGLFAAQHIKAGTVVWKWDDRGCLKLSKDQYDTLFGRSRRDSLVESLQRFAFWQTDDACVVDLDDARYINHHDVDFNLSCPESDDSIMIATRDVFPGEELLENYSQTIKNPSLCAGFLH